MADNQSETVLTVQKPWLFQPGNSANPAGRPKGSRNKLNEDFLYALQQSFQAQGPSVIETVIRERPHEYLKIIASILPKQIEIKENAFDGFSDEQLAALVYAARNALGFAESGGARDTN
jgi:hypothetical protein